MKHARSTPVTIALKRVYDPPSKSEDGMRVLVDRLWPRGVSKAAAGVDAWWKELTPSPELRKWFGHKPEKYAEFDRLYRKELAIVGPEIRVLLATAPPGRLTLVYAAADPVNNHALILADVLRAHLKT